MDLVFLLLYLEMRQLSNGVPWFYVDIPSFPVFMEGKVDVTQTHNGHI